MRALVTCFALLACACGTRTVGGEGSREPDPPKTSEFDAGAVEDERLLKVTHLDVEIRPVAERTVVPHTRVHLVLTDETGASRREEVGTFKGTCAETGEEVRAEPMHPFLGVECRHEGAGVDLRFVLREDVVVVLRAQVEDGSGEEPYYDEHVRIDLPKGGKVTID